MRVLVVDNDRDTADTLGMLLNAVHSCEVRVTYDAATCLIEAALFTPQLLLADLGMPGMDGMELARQIRQCRELDQTILIALTGWGDAEHREQALAAGFDEYLLKPVSLDRISELIARLIKGLHALAA